MFSLDVGVSPVRHSTCSFTDIDMIRRLLALLLAIALLPLAIPTGSGGSLGSRRHGTTAERSTSHGPVASLSESLLRSSAPARTSLRHESALPHAPGRRLPIVGEQSSSRHTHSARSLREGAALIPLRI
jgi:hypothetical protein